MPLVINSKSAGSWPMNTAINSKQKHILLSKCIQIRKQVGCFEANTGKQTGWNGSQGYKPVFMLIPADYSTDEVYKQI